MDNVGLLLQNRLELVQMPFDPLIFASSGNLLVGEAQNHLHTDSSPPWWLRSEPVQVTRGQILPLRSVEVEDAPHQGGLQRPARRPKRRFVEGYIGSQSPGPL